MMMLLPGKAVHLLCDSTGVPQPVLTWYRDGALLLHGSEGVTILDRRNSSELMVVDSMGQQGGEYNCSGSNVAGRTSVTFTVQCKYNGILTCTYCFTLFNVISFIIDLYPRWYYVSMLTGNTLGR